MEQPITFKNANNETLFGIVHIPDKTQAGELRIGINLLNPGIKYRVAPNRLNVKIARKLCENGYYVLRYDPSGIGDSESELPVGALVPEIWEKIQTGHFVNDTLTSNRVFCREFKLDRLVLAGNCGGAITALLVSEKDESVDGLCLIDIPVNLRTSKMSFADKVIEGGEKADWLFSEYIKRMFYLSSWYRLITVQTDCRALLKTMTMKFKKLSNTPTNKTGQEKKVEKLCQEGKLNKLVFKAFEAYEEKEKPSLFILAGNDAGTEIFRHYFQNIFLSKGDQDIRKNLHEISIIENANHVYTLFECQKLLLNRICEWLSCYFNTKTIKR